MITPYPRQTQAIDDTRAALRQHRRVLLQAPTGFGKTVIGALMARLAQQRRRRVWFICHRSELIFQTAQTFDKAGLDYGYIASGHRPNPYSEIQICGIDTLKRRVDKVDAPDLVLWDEAHHLGAAGWNAVQTQFDGAYHVGLSATPDRLDGKGLGEWFDYMVHGPSVSWLIENKFLSDYKLFAPSTPDLTGVHTRMGDYKKDELNEALDRSAIIGDLVTHYLKYARGKKTVVFAVSVKHSQHIANQFMAAGITALHLDGKTPKAERRAASQAFARGEVEVLCNVDLFGEGYDLAAQAGMAVTIECVISARPTQSLALWLQQCGRALRAKDYPAIILDHAGNALRHGLPDDDREWTLEGAGRRGAKSKSDDSVDLRQCPKCFLNHRPAPVCPECGHIYKVEARKVEEFEDELVEIDRDELRRQRLRRQGQAKTKEDLMATGMSEGQAGHIIAARQEKALLRRTLANLYMAMGVAFSAGDIARLKPKALRDEIARLQEPESGGGPEAEAKERMQA